MKLQTECFSGLTQAHRRTFSFVMLHALDHNPLLFTEVQLWSGVIRAWSWRWFFRMLGPVTFAFSGVAEEGMDVWAFTLVESVGGDLGHRVAVDSAVQRDDGGFRGHWSVAVLWRPVIAVEQNQETPVELRGRGTERQCEHITPTQNTFETNGPWTLTVSSDEHFGLSALTSELLISTCS